MQKTGAPSRGSRVRETWVGTEPAPLRNETSPRLTPLSAACSRPLRETAARSSRKPESGAPSTASTGTSSSAARNGLQ